MIIHTRFRDITLEEIVCSGHRLTHPETAAARWKEMRGKPITIEVPAYPGELVDSLCCGPFFHIWPYEFSNRQRLNVCPHVVEIGD